MFEDLSFFRLLAIKESVTSLDTSGKCTMPLLLAEGTCFPISCQWKLNFSLILSTPSPPFHQEQNNTHTHILSLTPTWKQKRETTIFLPRITNIPSFSGILLLSVYWTEASIFNGHCLLKWQKSDCLLGWYSNSPETIH